MNADALFDKSTPFDQGKINLLDQVFEAMTSGNGQKVTISRK